MPADETAPPLAAQVTLVLVVPLTVAANCLLFPVCSDVAVGETVMLTGAGAGLGSADTVNRNELDSVPFSGLRMLTEFVPALAISVAEMVTVARVELTTVVARREPFHSTTHLLPKLRPVTVMAKPALPAVAFAGESELRVGVFRPPHPT